MDKMIEHLIKMSDNLDKAGNAQCANAIDGLLQSGSMSKLAQYVGVIGYVLKQNRAMGNCIRKKRASSDTSMQEVVLSCLKEYQDGQQYDNTEWTSKYAQVIEDSPEHFESAHVDLLQILAEDNEIQKHMDQVKATNEVLAKSSVEDSLFKAAMTDIERLEKLLGKEGDDSRRPFKVAAPPSQRGNWSRFWSPTWTRRGKDKDTQFEMDAILESLMNIQSEVQQVRSSISNLRYYAGSIPDARGQQLAKSFPDSDWNSMRTNLDQLNMATPTTNENVTSEIDSILANEERIQNEIESVQGNMYNLRLRDPVKGRGQLSSAVNEYSDLSQALQRLYMNPLNEKALYYSQKLHGRLEDTLNARQGSQDPGYQDWSQSPEFESGPPDQGSPGSAAPGAPIEPPNSPLANAVQQISEDPSALDPLIAWLGQMRTTSMMPETKDAVNLLFDLLQEKRSGLQSVQTSNEPVSEQGGKKAWALNLSGLTPAKVNVRKLTKMADILEEVDEGLAELLRDYLREQEEELPYFPETASLIKEELSSGWKIR